MGATSVHLQLTRTCAPQLRGVSALHLQRLARGFAARAFVRAKERVLSVIDSMGAAQAVGSTPEGSAGAAAPSLPSVPLTPIVNLLCALHTSLYPALYDDNSLRQQWQQERGGQNGSPNARGQDGGAKLRGGASSSATSPRDAHARPKVEHYDQYVSWTVHEALQKRGALRPAFSLQSRQQAVRSAIADLVRGQVRLVRASADDDEGGSRTTPSLSLLIVSCNHETLVVRFPETMHSSELRGWLFKHFPLAYTPRAQLAVFACARTFLHADIARLQAAALAGAEVRRCSALQRAQAMAMTGGAHMVRVSELSSLASH